VEFDESSGASCNWKSAPGIAERERCTFQGTPQADRKKRLAVLKKIPADARRAGQAEKEAIGKIRKLKEQMNNQSGRTKARARRRTGQGGRNPLCKISAAERDLKQAQERFSAVQKERAELKKSR